MTAIKTTPWNTEDHLETPENIAAYLEAVFADGDPELISHALGAVARSKGMTEVARRTCLRKIFRRSGRIAEIPRSTSLW